MKQIYLVRHGVAEKRDSARWPDDSQRPLTPQGIARFRIAARGLARIVPTVGLVLSSSYTRSWETAELLGEVARWPAPERCRELEADQTSGAALHALQALGKPASLALVGHEPNLSSLASLLLTGHEDALELELKKGAVALVETQDDVPPGTGVLRWSVSPKILRSLDSIE